MIASLLSFKASCAVVSAACIVTFASASTLNASNSANAACNHAPGDAGWPSASEWSTLNATVGGRLLATKFLAQVCHASTFDAAACEALTNPIDWDGSPPTYVTRFNLSLTNWDNAVTFISKPAEMMNAYWQNMTCDPFSHLSRPCSDLGNYAVYSINVTNADDVKAGLKFCAEKKIRLSIKNTGHDYNGKSSGRASLSLWMHNLKTMQVISNYEGPTYSGPAMKLGAGVNAGDALLYAAANGYRIVTGECGTVGISGGYSQGGGHGPLNSAYGLASDNVLEWELVTGTGEHVVATPKNNSDLYWALSGGGGGTYGVVLSMTTRIHPDGPVAGPLLTFSSPNVGNDTYWNAVKAFVQGLPRLINGTTNSVQFSFYNNYFGAVFALVDMNEGEANSTLEPLASRLDTVGQAYQIIYPNISASFADYYESWYGPEPYGLSPPSTILNSRIVPQSVVDGSNTDKLIDAMKLTTETGEFQVACSASDVTQSQHADNAVLPAWRKSIFGCNINAFWDYEAPLSTNYEVKSRMVNVYSPAWDAATPGSGVYGNELDPWYKGNFKDNIYGSNYDRLLKIKKRNDPNNLFYGHHAVGSDEYTIDVAGRLCYSG